MFDFKDVLKYTKYLFLGDINFSPEAICNLFYDFLIPFQVIGVDMSSIVEHARNIVRDNDLSDKVRIQIC